MQINLLLPFFLLLECLLIIKFIAFDSRILSEVGAKGNVTNFFFSQRLFCLSQTVKSVFAYN